MRKFNSSLFQLLILANFTLLFVSCQKDPSDIGLNIQPGSDRMDLFVDTISVDTYTYSESRIAADERSISPLGSYTDPVFGFVKADFATQLRLSSSNADFSSNIENADSLVLYLKYNGQYGDVSVSHQIKVYEILNDIYIDSVYYSDYRFEESDLNLLEQISFVPEQSDSIIRVSMPQDLIDRIINPANSNYFSDNNSFNEFFKGIYVSVDDQPADGSILYANLLSEESKMTLHYNDSLEFNFLINSSCARINMFNHDYSYASSELNAVLDDTITPNQISYTQSLSGPKIKILIPELGSFADSTNVAINKAQLIINVASDNQFAPPPKMTLVSINNEGLNEFLTDYKVNTTYFGGELNETQYTYTFNIPFYLQELLLDNSLLNNGLYLYPQDNRVSANRARIFGGADLDNPMQIRIMYSKF
ncbi:MAG TPA: DUF4270 domain-containing protein [Bacteroidales bacterium]|nr:DUF4270 domain-containing protein [Bacteroidales bacterium]